MRAATGTRRLDRMAARLIFQERRSAPYDAEILIGIVKIVTLDRPALAAAEIVQQRCSLFIAVSPTSWHGAHFFGEIARL
jgi:hypothetical protein